MGFNSSTKYALFIAIISIAISFITCPDSDTEQYCRGNNETIDTLINTVMCCQINSNVSENFIN